MGAVSAPGRGQTGGRSNVDLIVPHRDLKIDASILFCEQLGYHGHRGAALCFLISLYVGYVVSRIHHAVRRESDYYLRRSKSLRKATKWFYLLQSLLLLLIVGFFCIIQLPTGGNMVH
jgi:hypothetical protein